MNVKIDDPRDPDLRAADARKSLKQRRSMGKPDKKRLLDVLGRMRSVRAEAALARFAAIDAGGPAPIQFDLVDEGGPAPTLVASGELVVPTEAVDRSAELRAELETAGFQRSTVPPELAGHVERYVRSGITGDALSELARKLRGQGYPVSANNIAPMGYWIKSQDGPEHTNWYRPAPELPAGLGPVVAVVDTGIETLGVRTDGWLDEISRTATNVDELDGPDPGSELDLGAGHGTFTSGIIRQVSSNAEIRVIKALDASGIGTDVEVAAAMVRAVQDGAQILNLSLGTQTVDDVPPPALAAALEIIDAHVGPNGELGTDVLIVAAAGNFGDTRPCWPGAFDRAVAVAALTAAGTPSAWSSHGPWVTCSAVGEGISSTYVQGVEDSANDPKPETFGPNDWAMWIGTSFAAPQIAGVSATVSRDQNLPPRTACAQILAAGKAVPDYGQAVTILPGT